MKMTARVSVVLTLLFSAFFAMAGENQVRTINGEFTSQANGDMSFSVPLSIIDTVKPQIEEALNGLESEGIKFGELWASIKDSGPNEFVSVKNDQADIKVFTTATHLRVSVDEKSEGAKIEVSIPLTVCDALFADGGIDFDSIMSTLESMVGEEIVNIQSDDMNGRVWID